jgi:ribosomal protein S18 acetylase RimI-like enzyme
MGNSQISDIYCAIKQQSKNKIWTNIYSHNPLDYLKKIESKNTSLFIRKNAFVLLEDIGQIKKIHFLLEACDNSMDIFNDIKLKKLTLELIEDGRNSRFIESLGLYGFSSYATLVRMTQANRENINTKTQGKIEYANLDDVNVLVGLYSKYFDILIDRIPDIFEIEGQVKDRLIICSKDSGNISAFASIFLSPGTITLNHIFVRPEFRGRKIGESLLRFFLSLALESKRARLWVLPSNTPAISLYQKYNFIFDGLKNLIYTKNEE